MKKTFLKISLTTLLGFLVLKPNIYAAYNQVSYTIHGNIKGLPDQTTVYLLKINDESKIDTICTVISKNGTFQLKGNDEIEGKFHAIALNQTDIKKAIPTGLDPIPFIIENKNISITGNITLWPKLSFENSPTNEIYYKLIEEIRSINRDMRARFPSGGPEMDSIYAHTIKQTLLKYPDNYGTGAVLEKYLLTLNSDQVKAVYGSFTPKNKNSYYGKIINKQLHYLIDPHSVKEGNKIPDFKFVTESGDSISIVEYAMTKEYVLIDIWASWCTPCRAEVPNLKKVYNTYSEKGLGIVSLSIDKSETSWLEALKKEDMPWTQARDPQERIAGGVFRASSIPVYILINKEGKLISFQAGQSGVDSFGPRLRGEELHSTLLKLFGF